MPHGTARSRDIDPRYDFATKHRPVGIGMLRPHQMLLMGGT